MIVFLILSFFVFNNCDKRLFVTIYFSCSCYLALFLIAVNFQNVEYLASDEWRYFHWSNQYLSDGNDRALWLYINMIIKDYDFFGEFFIKIINIPISVYLLDKINSIFNIKNKLTVFILSPFILVLAVSNLRDLLILTATIQFCVELNNLKNNNLKNYIYLATPAVFLFLLRPIMLFLAVLIYIIFNSKKYLTSGVKGAAKLISISIVILLILFSTSAGDILSSFLYNGNYFIEEGISIKAEAKGFGEYFNEDNLTLTLANASARYIFTPIPTSVLSRLLSDHFHQHSIYSEIIRLFHQLVYYFVLVFLFFNWRKIFYFLTKMSFLYKIILLNLVVYMPVYTIYSFGGVHQRTKFPFQIALIIIYVLYKQQKKNISTRKN